jgi:predicted xylose isomerase-like sugar epimerase
MADVNVSLDSSDLPVIVEALEFKNAALRRTASKKREIEHRPLADQVNLLNNTFRSLQ